MPHSTFLGGDGRWTQDDRDKAIWWLIRERERCPGCGTRADEWDPAKGGHAQAYTAAPRRCPGCFSLDAAAKQWEDHAGIYPILKPRG